LKGLGTHTGHEQLKRFRDWVPTARQSDAEMLQSGATAHLPTREHITEYHTEHFGITIFFTTKQQVTGCTKKSW
jgi:hypothetical protein